MWKIPKIWEGGECWIIGGGPSMPRQFGVPEDIIQDVIAGRQMPSVYSPFLSSIHGKHIIAVNAAYLLGDWIDVIFFGDRGFFLHNQKGLLEHPNIKTTCCSHVKNQPGVKYIPKDKNYVRGISTKTNQISWNNNSGAAAINLAYYFGVKRIVLLGFDMHVIEGTQHWHGEYKKVGAKKLPFSKHLRSFPFIARDAKKLGVEILNISPDSTIQDFKKVKIEDVL